MILLFIAKRRLCEDFKFIHDFEPTVYFIEHPQTHQWIHDDEVNSENQIEWMKWTYQNHRGGNMPKPYLELKWTNDPLKAKRFESIIEAENYLRGHEINKRANETCIITEHEFVDPPETKK
jgi:hypothetical protein